MTSINPLRIYLYKNGLVRFATDKFSTDPEVKYERVLLTCKCFINSIMLLSNTFGSIPCASICFYVSKHLGFHSKRFYIFFSTFQLLSNMYIHLTNFSVNKKGEVPKDYPEGCQVNKWTIYQLWDYMKKEDNVDPEPFWEGVKDVVIKTLLCGHENIDRMMKASASSNYNNFNLLGLDIFIDTDLRPYLLEVNTIPSLFINQVSKEIDLELKAPLIAETFNICGHHISSGVAAKYKTEITSAHLPGTFMLLASTYLHGP